MGIKHVKRVRGEPPSELELEIQGQEHDFGTYPLMVLVWEDATRGAPWEYIEKCETQLELIVRRALDQTRFNCTPGSSIMYYIGCSPRVDPR